MKAEALIGKTLGTCTLQKLVGQGGMGAVYLAQQSRPRRQVAVKVLLPMTPLNANQFAAFLERFRRETDAAASLEHPNIIPVHEYGEQDGIVYLVMPYISGGTFRDLLEVEGPLPLQKALDYLEQLSLALDFAHEHGVIHRDIKPANIMVTPEGRLLLSDFGLVKIVGEGKKPQMRLTGAGAPVGTPDYMAPEQVIGEEVDTRADLYSLGVILFQMLTGTTPFQGETPMQIAAQHLQIPPPSPQMLRSDLPIAVEQVVLRSLAKRPVNRYRYAQDMANAFRAALIKSGMTLEATATSAGLISGTTASRLATPKGQFDHVHQTASLPKIAKKPAPPPNIPDMPMPRKGGRISPTRKNTTIRPAHPVSPTMVPEEPMRLKPHPQAPVVTGKDNLRQAAQAQNNPMLPPSPGSGLLSRTGKFPMVGTGTTPSSGPKARSINETDMIPRTREDGGSGLLSRTGKFQTVGSNQPSLGLGQPTIPPVKNRAETDESWVQEPLTPPDPGRMLAPLAPSSLPVTGEQARTRTVTLNDPVKVVKVPVAGQPGQYITGILPFTDRLKEADVSEENAGFFGNPWVKYGIAVLCVFVLLGSLGTYLFLQNRNQTSTATNITTPTTNTNSNTILFDPLSQNTHGWNNNPQEGFNFVDGAYHISAVGNTDNGIYLPNITLPATLGYTITMEEIKGNDTSSSNSFGMLFRFSKQQKGNKVVTTFYSFEVVNSTQGGEYQFWSFDDSRTQPWHMITNGKLPSGKEFHAGHGPNAVNTIKVFMNGNHFIVTVNGTQLSRVFQDSTLTGGTIGMIVNQNGTEVAYKNLLLTRN